MILFHYQEYTLSSRVCLLHVESLYTWKNYYGMIYKNGRFCNGKDSYVFS